LAPCEKECHYNVGTPKELPLDEVDFDGKEWNVDFFCHDTEEDPVLGLIKLGDSG